MPFKMKHVTTSFDLKYINTYYTAIFQIEYFNSLKQNVLKRWYALGLSLDQIQTLQTFNF